MDEYVLSSTLWVYNIVSTLWTWECDRLRPLKWVGHICIKRAQYRSSPLYYCYPELCVVNSLNYHSPQVIVHIGSSGFVMNHGSKIMNHKKIDVSYHMWSWLIILFQNPWQIECCTIHLKDINNDQYYRISAPQKQPILGKYTNTIFMLRVLKVFASNFNETICLYLEIYLLLINY